VEGNGRGLILDIQQSVWSHWREPQRISYRFGCLWALHWTWDVLIIKQKCCPFSRNIWCTHSLGRSLLFNLLRRNIKYFAIIMPLIDLAISLEGQNYLPFKNPCIIYTYAYTVYIYIYLYLYSVIHFLAFPTLEHRAPFRGFCNHTYN
jgi:hypothetical protein